MPEKTAPTPPPPPSLNIKWTNKNVENLGVFFGNDNPAVATVQKISPKVIISINYWKQFRVSTLAKARVMEIFHAMKLWYAARFYPIPPPLTKALQKAFFEYVNFPHKTVTIKREEMIKLRRHGGSKLISRQANSEASKMKCLIDLCVLSELKTYIDLIMWVTKKGGATAEICFSPPHITPEKYCRSIPHFIRNRLHP